MKLINMIELTILDWQELLEKKGKHVDILQSDRLALAEQVIYRFGKEIVREKLKKG